MTRIPVFAFILISIFSSIRSQPERVWEIQQVTESQEKNSGLPSLAGSRPLKIRLVNYEQRQLILKQQGKVNLDTLRQKARGAPNQQVQSAVPLGAQSPDGQALDRFPGVDSLHQARNLFEERRSDGSSLSPLSELEIKSDRQLQKYMQRTTVRTKIYPTEPIDADTGDGDGDRDLINPTTTPLPQTSTTRQTPGVVTPTIVPQVSVQVPQFTLAPFSGFTPQNLTQPNFNFGLGFPPQPPPVPQSLPVLQSPPALQPIPVSLSPVAQQPSPVTLPSPSPSNLTATTQFEQLGCGFDLLTNSCKDVFGLGWCQGCEDFGNIFLHDCRCTKPAPKNSSTLPSTGIQQVIQQQIPQQQLLNTTPAGAIQNFFVPPTFFGF
ncbi:hypothetical protein FO519_000170 [Halicephalobus sp. NKZ332]|nr:hypothetical protein FO519_000170 [Halicephalobus sp. NKZ332]